MKLFSHLRDTVLPFVDSCRQGEKDEIGRFRYSAATKKNTLYSSAYAAMTYSLLGALDNLDQGEKRAWADYFNGHQDSDGLYRDPAIYGQGWYKNDPLWCGRAHLSCHILTALGSLGYTAEKPLLFLAPYKDKDKFENWLSKLDFGEKVAWTGNEIMNIGTLLQYSRDFHNDRKAGEAVIFLLEWLFSHHINRESGIWGTLDVSDPIRRSHAVQAAYHWWPLFFYDNYPVPHMERAIDTALLTQNPSGGFGWGVHNPDSPFDSSACEDIDSIDPLARMSALIPYRRGEVTDALLRAKRRVLANQAPDGGFVFYKGKEFEYGHRELFGPADAGAMFPTWFRTLSLALIDRYLCKIDNMNSPYKFTNIPGFQF
ncbi:MAG: hypothetical protein FWG34_06395 [Oscillospiraceae bacterium]|nr:hypothetical protein [Oscillospiraceae bacterium]